VPVVYSSVLLAMAGLLELVAAAAFQPGNKTEARARRARRSNPLRTVERKIEPL
jgi:hypothetical protein